MSEVIYTKSKEECVDDFEKDLDWLIHEESRGEDQGPAYEEIEAAIDKELQEDDEQAMERKGQSDKQERKGSKAQHVEEDEERWPPPMEPLEYESHRAGTCEAPFPVPPPPEPHQTEEEKKYILEKIQQANRELEEQVAPDFPRQRRLQFKKNLVDLVVPPCEYENNGNCAEVNGKNVHVERAGNEAENVAENAEGDIAEVQGRHFQKERSENVEGDGKVSGQLSELNLSPPNESGGQGESVNNAGGKEAKESRVLVEKDGKFDLVSLKDVENQGLLPPLGNFSDSCCSPQAAHLTRSTAGTLKSSSFRPRGASPSSFRPHAATKGCVDHLRAPRPPAEPKDRPSSNSHKQRGFLWKKNKRRVQSAMWFPCPRSSEYKEALQKIQEKKERLAREAAQKKLEEEEMKRQQNELAFQAWLMRKKGQFQEKQKIQRAREMERDSVEKDTSDPQEAYRLWLQRKLEQQQKEKQLRELRRMEEDTSYMMHSREDCERSFKMWMRRKRVEKHAQQHAVRQCSRRMALEEQRSRNMREVMYAISETKPFRFTDDLPHHL